MDRNHKFKVPTVSSNNGQQALAVSAPVASSSAFSVLYAKRGPKKLKSWSDGTLTLTRLSNEGGRVVLKDLSQQRLGASNVNEATAASLFTGDATLDFGGMEVKIQSIVPAADASSPAFASTTTSKNVKRPLGVVSNRFVPLIPSKSNSFSPPLPQRIKPSASDLAPTFRPPDAAYQSSVASTPVSLCRNNSQQALAASVPVANSFTFSVLYAKRGPKKLKTWSDGTLTLTRLSNEGGRVVLEDLSQQRLGASNVNEATVASLLTGDATLDFGGMEVKIQSIVPAADASSAVETRKRQPAFASTTTSQNAKRPLVVVSNRFVPLVPSKSNSVSPPLPQRNKPSASILAPTFQPPDAACSSSEASTPMSLCPKKQPLALGMKTGSGSSRARTPLQDIADPLARETGDAGIKTLLRSLQPHQVEAVQFLWRASQLCARDSDLHSSSSSSGGGGGGGAGGTGVSGAILADSMGLGKTLTSIAFVYAALHHGLAKKVVVVVPSSLVQNWANEFSKWLRHSLSPHAGGANHKVLVSSASASNGGSSRSAAIPAKNKKKTKLLRANGGSGGGEGHAEEEEDALTNKAAAKGRKVVIGGAEQAVVDFVTTRAPVLVISYEGYRKHAAHLNRHSGEENSSSSSSSSSGYGGGDPQQREQPRPRQQQQPVGMLVCDEGHRLKNAAGSKTLQCLEASPAHYRLLLTGTPVQNDLGELFAMVNFVRPGLLGTSPAAFKKRFGGCIEKGRDLGAASEELKEGRAKAAQLRSVLGECVLRRTADVLVKSLPPRLELVVFCRLSSEQRLKYARAVAAAQGSGLVPSSPEKEEEEVEVPLETSSEEDCVASGGGGGAGVRFDPLQAIHRMRQICNHPCLVDEEATPCRDATLPPSSLASLVKTAHRMSPPPPKSKASEAAKRGALANEELNVEASGKLRVLEALLAEIYAPACLEQRPSSSSSSSSSYSYSYSSSSSSASSSSSSSVAVESSSVPSSSTPQQRQQRERVVVVSNFTSSLDLVAAMAARKGWGCLRIDGTVAVDSRQGLVDRFNKRLDDTFLFLLSSHAGGAGLNLVGGSRLVLYDSDWNPAVDQQTMGRVWRQGQARPVVIYRLLSTGTLEEKMFQRQVAKGELSCTVETTTTTTTAAAAAAAAAVGGGSKHEKDDVRHFHKEDLRQLFHFRPDVPKCDTFECMRGRWGGDGSFGGGDNGGGDGDDLQIEDDALRCAAAALPGGTVSYVHRMVEAKRSGGDDDVGDSAEKEDGLLGAPPVRVNGDGAGGGSAVDRESAASSLRRVGGGKRTRASRLHTESSDDEDDDEDDCDSEDSSSDGSEDLFTEKAVRSGHGKKQTNDADFRNEEHNEDSYGAGTRSLKGLVEDEAEEEEDSESEFDDGGEMGDSE